MLLSIDARLALPRALAVVLFVLAAGPVHAQPRSEDAYLFLVQRKAVVKGVVNGNVGVNDPGGRLKVGRSARLATGTLAVADAVFLRGDLQVFDVFANALHFSPGRAIIAGTITQPVPLPVYAPETLVVPDPFDPVNFPPVFPITCGGPSKLGDLDEVFALAPGSYDTVRVNRGGGLVLGAGTYSICDLKIDRNADLEVTGPVTLNLRDSFLVKNAASVLPLGALGANDVQINFGGNGAVRIGQGAVFNARLFAPNAFVRLGRRSTITGHIVSQDLKSDRGFIATPGGPVCGNGQLEASETCDPPGSDPAPPGGSLCRSDCTYCGDGFANGGEECDDGNADDGDGCRNDCTLPAPPPSCGDGSLNQPGETCDPPGSDPAPPGGNLCRADCTYCGDAMTNGTEECDDGNADDGDGCRNDCTLPAPACVLQVTKTCRVEEAPPPSGGQCQGGVVSMTLRYTGEGCDATTNSQSGKALCDGDPNGAEPVAVVLTADLGAATVTPDTESIVVGGEVTITATGDKLKADTRFAVQQGGVTRQALTVHTSCSQPLAVGDQFGGMLLVSLTSKDGGTFTLPEPPAPSDVCEVSSAPPPPHCQGKVLALSLRYTGGDCTISNPQGGKATCTLGVATGEPVQIVITRDASTIGVDPATETVGLGDVFTITPVSGTLKADTEFDIRRGGTTLQHLKIHTSCSQPLDVGDRFGAVEVAGVLSTDGGLSADGAGVTYEYVVTNTGSTTVSGVSVVDDVLGIVAGSPIATLAPGESATLSVTAFVDTGVTNVVTASGTASGGSCGATDSAEVTVVEPPVLPAACDDDHKVGSITFRYTGEGCAASNNPQGGKATCTLGASFASPVRILIRDDKDGSVVYGDVSGVPLDGTVSGTAANASQTEFKAQSRARIFNAGGGLIEEVSFHTSCSQPLAVGDRFGSLEIVALGLLAK